MKKNDIVFPTRARGNHNNLTTRGLLQKWEAFHAARCP
ncbi:hypothetical protein BN137_2044 [Cronobacter condimenti 1330]|uniref:Uncharacterized protein n=1 Tax=Cronobacter condimenti 1330 TaxID=1073999 RepID=K8A0F4_9ENTR|nr:hypothetical protein BN137_2044 [Cronobacter condimenti 1330]